MKADPTQQRTLIDLAGIDTELSRLAHRQSHLVEQQEHEAAQQRLRAAEDRLAALRLAQEDLDAEVAKFEAEIDGVRSREQRDRNLLASPNVQAKQVAEISHELETLERRQASLEDSLLEVMERREELQAQYDAEERALAGLRADADTARHNRDDALVQIDTLRAQRAEQRRQLAGGIDPELLALYDKQRASGGVGAGVLQGHRCGACRIELDRGELSRIAAAADDEVLRCPECRAILVRVTP
ncbi:C4-type zinc ribbon domain-containing protein [Mycobacterium sp. MYCO198283]|uniref:zinc ribbon domain-containing protein n=1 Tax=Mycobacterium sp. MYCO198283 TaxID=2883505 RepID=UPI001E323D36|nr:C4-type zinc ribbon domain-containing protein [Mycobacterium sp. MYCO198283]MCG5432656.1 C4-type zinc ribbon domain-containing protein [Mycobacterium sp. MYCO198283]